MIKDTLGRELHDLRISVTDRCNFRCSFCMPEGEEYEFFRREEILSFEEITKFVMAIIPLGVKKVRLTGGEPLLRRNLERLIAYLSELPLEDLSLTTNGFLLKEKAKLLKEAGLKRVTVSLHSLKDEVFSRLVGRKVKVYQIIEGIEESLKVGLTPVKVNVCVIRGINHTEIVDIARFFKSMGVVVRFIEFMDVGNINGWSLEKVYSAREMLELLSKRFELEPVEKSYRGEVADRYRYKDDGVEVGFISSITQPFCGDCNRLRLTADGKVLTCLFAQDCYDVKGLIRGSASDEEIREFISKIWAWRSDRYSEQRLEFLENGIMPRKVEMFRVGG
ncbi:GTP 3',8-cyclase MoaA [Hydrogenobacter sp. T-2]|uniref:GTP 3',8-cyclase MoaA n=1 Tax=Pampinifervens diazotrophicum TaxID=1632018 RepID=UPI002B25A205|nr:GTP 3',8-cyclase MoaA [Hydrogenobacter sp. T-2]WPM33025.1 GTP 3',8-cyclase MoaA [Hydrogenobacter sp. T-2]